MSDEIVREFLAESKENLDRLDQDFVRLESEPENRELLKSIFRTIHTIKGTSTQFWLKNHRSSRRVRQSTRCRARIPALSHRVPVRVRKGRN